MRLLVSLVMTGLLLGFAPRPRDVDHSDVKVYRARPRVEVSAVTAKDRVIAAFVRHSGGGVLLQLTPGRPALGIPKTDIDLSIPLDSPPHIVFNSGGFENFDRSRDLFKDGRVVLVPLREDGGRAVGVFVNLLSRKRWFFAPTVTSQAALAQIRALARRRDIIVVVPDNPRAHERLAEFPESQQ
jgi:hypothetical protein